MTPLPTLLDPRSAAAQANAARMATLVQDLRATVDHIRLGGGDTARTRHTGRGEIGRASCRERV